MSILTVVFVIVLAHIIGDYLLQPGYHFRYHEYTLKIVSIHTIIYIVPIIATTFLIPVSLSWFVLNFFIHWLIDYCSNNQMSKMWVKNEHSKFCITAAVDQSFHVFILLASYFWLV